MLCYLRLINIILCKGHSCAHGCSRTDTPRVTIVFRGPITHMLGKSLLLADEFGVDEERNVFWTSQTTSFSIEKQSNMCTLSFLYIRVRFIHFPGIKPPPELICRTFHCVAGNNGNYSISFIQINLRCRHLIMYLCIIYLLLRMGSRGCCNNCNLYVCTKLLITIINKKFINKRDLYFKNYIGGPTSLIKLNNLSNHLGGAEIWAKVVYFYDLYLATINAMSFVYCPFLAFMAVC